MWLKPRSEFHAQPGQNYPAQPGGHVGIAGAIEISGPRGPVLGTSAAASGMHIPKTLDMNPSRPTQSYYQSGPRAQHPRNICQRTGQVNAQNQVHGLQGLPNSAQATALYNHSTIPISATTMYLQNQVTGLHANPHQQNVYPMNNQLAMQYATLPARHQAHQNQFPYQSYQNPTFVSYGYAQSTQHPGYYYPQTPNPQHNVSRSGANNVSNNNHTITSSITNPQGAGLVPPGGIHQPNQTTQPLQNVSLQLSQPDIYSNFNSGLSLTTQKSKKLRTKAILDIVDPNTGRNICADIYEDKASVNVDNSKNLEYVQSQARDAKIVAANFAAQVAKVASEPKSTKLINASGKFVTSPNSKEDTICSQQKSEILAKIPLTSPEKENIIQNDSEININCLSKSNQDAEENTKRKIHSLEVKKNFEEDQESKEILEINDSSTCSLNNIELKKDIISEKIEENTGHKWDHSKNISLNIAAANKEKKDLDIIPIASTDTNLSGLSIDKEIISIGDDIHFDLQEDIRKKSFNENLNDSEILKNKFPDNSLNKNINLLSSVVCDKINISENQDLSIDQNPIQESLLCKDIVTENKFKESTNLGTTSENSTLESKDIISAKSLINKEDFLQLNLESKQSNLSDRSSDSETLFNNPDLKSTTTASTLFLKYTYTNEQWSPINTSGKKVYDREFLMKLQNDPNSKMKPTNLPDLDVVLKDNTKNRNLNDSKLKDASSMRHESLFPGFAKSSISKVQSLGKKSHTGKLKISKPNVIHVQLSLREDVKLRETKNAWKPTRFSQNNISEEYAKSEALYKRVRSVLNKLTPQKFNTLVNQVRELQIDSQKRLQGVIDLVFEKAIDEPNFSVAYALMCKELSNMAVTGADSENSTADFRKLILTRCQTEFEKNTVDETVRNNKLKEIEDCVDVERKKELQTLYEEEERRIRIKSVGNIRFIGELFKQNMLTCNIMHTCIRHLLKQVDEENLECLCKLLTTIGKALEAKQIDLTDYFKQMQQIANKKGKISSRIRFMLQDVIDLRENKWIPRRDDTNPKTMEQIQKEAESERLSIHSNTLINAPRKDDRSSDRKRIRAGSILNEEGVWSQPNGKMRTVYSVETARLKSKPPSVDDMQLGSRSNYQWPKPNPKMTTQNKFCCLENVSIEAEKTLTNFQPPRSKLSGSKDTGKFGTEPFYDPTALGSEICKIPNLSGFKDGISSEKLSSETSILKPEVFERQNNESSLVPDLSDEVLQIHLNNILEDFVAEQNVQEAVNIFSSLIPSTNHSAFVREVINTVLERSDIYREKTSILLSHLLTHQCIKIINFNKGLEAILEAASDLLIDIPKLWIYIAKILVHPVMNDVYSLQQLNLTLCLLPDPFRSQGVGLEILAELLSDIIILKESDWVLLKWKQCGLSCSDFVNNDVIINHILQNYRLEFLNEDLGNQNHRLLEVIKKKNFDEICSWIQVNVNNQVKDPEFIKSLMTAILESSTEMYGNEGFENWVFKVEKFESLQKLIQRFVDADEYLELQCLFAIQKYIHKLSHPSGLLLKIMTHLHVSNVLSNEAFLAWEKNNDPAETEGKATALSSLKSFFIPLKEVEDISSGDET